MWLATDRLSAKTPHPGPSLPLAPWERGQGSRAGRHESPLSCLRQAGYPSSGWRLGVRASGGEGGRG